MMTDWVELARARKAQEAQGLPTHAPVRTPMPARTPMMPPPFPTPPPPPAPYQPQAPVPVPPPPPPPAPPPVEIDWLSRVKEHAQQSGVEMSTVEEEVARILNLPYYPHGIPRCPDRKAYGESFLAPTTPDPNFRLWDVQLDAIYTYETLGGLLGPIGVGRGKSFIAILSANRAILRRGHYRVAIMVPPEVYDQLTKIDLPKARQLFNLNGIPYYVCSGPAAKRMSIAKQPGKGVWIYSYSSLSTKTGFEELKEIRSTCYILDEAHNLARSTAGRTKRFHSVLKELEAEKVVEYTQKMTGAKKVMAIEVVALSGTLTKKSVKDYAHLATRSLGLFSPTPIKGPAITAFSGAIDAESSGQTLCERDASVLGQYIHWANKNGFDATVPPRRDEEEDQEYRRRCSVGLTRQETVRLAYMHRLNTAPGVVATVDQGLDASLLLSWFEPIRPQDAEAETMVNLMKKVVIEQTTPSGDTIDYGMHQFKWLWELSNGFYNNLIWPTEQEIAEQYPNKFGKVISLEHAQALLQQAVMHHKLLQEYHAVLRKFLDTKHIPGCDTPMLVAAEINRQLDGTDVKYKLLDELIESYAKQRAEGPHTYEDLPERYSVPVKVCDYKVKAAVQWAKEHKEGIIWYHHPVIGRWVDEHLTEAGIEHTFAPAGQNTKAFNSGLVVASYAHGTGKNLQHQYKNLFVELRREASINEQTLGRTHRSGQKVDQVRGWLMIGNGFDLAMFNATLKDADYIQSTLGQRQRLCYASYDPVIPPTSPTLMLRLGIIKNLTEATQPGQAWDVITPSNLRDIAKVFRPLAYGTGGVAS